MALTLDEAKEEAKRRWGPRAIACHNFQISRNCEVSNDVPSRSPAIHGVGDTFEEAFADAEVKNPFRSCTCGIIDNIKCPVHGMTPQKARQIRQSGPF